MLLQHFDRLAVCIPDCYLERHLPGEGVCRTPEAGIVSPKGHLNHVQQSFVDNRPFLDQVLSSFLDRHADRGVVIGCANDQNSLP